METVKAASPPVETTGAPPQETCRLTFGAFSEAGVVRCPVCYHLVPPESIGYKLHCRRCGYLESCCNPL